MGGGEGRDNLEGRWDGGGGGDNLEGGGMGEEGEDNLEGGMGEGEGGDNLEGGMGRREGTHVYPWPVHADVWRRPAQRCKAIWVLQACAQTQQGTDWWAQAVLCGRSLGERVRCALRLGGRTAGVGWGGVGRQRAGMGHSREAPPTAPGSVHLVGPHWSPAEPDTPLPNTSPAPA